MGLRQYWGRLVAVAEAWVRQMVHDSCNDDVAVGNAPASSDLERCATGETEERVPVAAVGEVISTPSPPATSSVATGDQNQWIQRRGWAEKIVRQLQGQMLGGARRAISTARLHMVGICWMPEVSTEQSDEDGRKYLKRIYEYTKKAMSFEALLLLALLNQPQQSLYPSNTAFKVSLAMLLVAFFANLLTGVLLVNSFTCFLPFFKYPIYISSIIQMLVPFGLLVSSGHLQPSMILVSPLPFFSIALFHRAADTTDDASSALDHIFDKSAGVYALLSTGCALITSPCFISCSSVEISSPLACSLFVTILIARYLMLISTLRPPVIVEHARTLMLILKLLLALTVIFIAVEFLGWRRALLVIAVSGTDAALFFMFLLVHSNTSLKTDHQTSDHQQQRKDQKILSAVLVSILFTALTQTYSEHAAAGGKEETSPLGSAAVLRLLLYFGAFLWSLNRMLISLALGDDDVAAPAPPQGGHALPIRVWSGLELIRASVVVVAALDMIYKFGRIALVS